MAILQALFSLISRSAGNILKAIFGWAVRALFGQPSEAEQMFLTGIVAAAAAWPVLLLGIAVPKLAALLIAFVPFHNRVPTWLMRSIWAGLALLVPIAVGLAVAAKAPPGSLREPVWKRIARGWPITLGLASAFLLMFFTVPALKIASIVRRRQDEQVPLVTHSSSYDAVAGEVLRTLNRYGYQLERAQPGWWVTAPTKILLKLGGAAFRNYAPENIAYFREPDRRTGLEVALYPNGLLLRGEQYAVIRAHGLVSEALSRTEALQTMDTTAQAIELRLHSLWQWFDRDPQELTGEPRVIRTLERLTSDLCAAKIPFADWQVLYRQLLQLELAVRGYAPLIARAQAAEAPAEVGESLTPAQAGAAAAFHQG